MGHVTSRNSKILKNFNIKVYGVRLDAVCSETQENENVKVWKH